MEIMENMENFEVYRNPNYNEKIKLQRFFTQLQIAASFFKKHFVGKTCIMKRKLKVLSFIFHLLISCTYVVLITKKVQAVSLTIV